MRTSARWWTKAKATCPLSCLVYTYAGPRGSIALPNRVIKRMKHTWLLLARFGDNEDQSCSCWLDPSISRRPFPHGASCVKRANSVLLSYFNYNLDSGSVFRLRTSIYRPYSQSMDNVHVALASPWTLDTPQRTSGDAQSSRVNYGLLVLDAAWQGALVCAEGDTGACIQ